MDDQSKTKTMMTESFKHPRLVKGLKYIYKTSLKIYITLSILWFIAGLMESNFLWALSVWAIITAFYLDIMVWLSYLALDRTKANRIIQHTSIYIMLPIIIQAIGVIFHISEINDSEITNFVGLGLIVFGFPLTVILLIGISKIPYIPKYNEGNDEYIDIIQLLIICLGILIQNYYLAPRITKYIRDKYMRARKVVKRES